MGLVPRFGCRDSILPTTTLCRQRGVDSVSGVKHQQVTVFNKMQNSAKTLGKC